MRKRLISVCIAVISVFSIYGCTKTDEDTAAAEAETVETENTDAADEETAIIEDIPAVETEIVEEENTKNESDEALAGIGYMFYGADGNGIEELIIADTGSDGWNNRILLMYSLLDDKPVLMIDGWARNRYYLLNDGTIYNEGSGGAAHSVFAIFRMAEDEISLKVIDYYSSGYYGNSEWGWFHSTTGETTEDESEPDEED